MSDDNKLTPAVNWAEIDARMKMQAVKRKAELMDSRKEEAPEEFARNARSLLVGSGQEER